MSKIPESWIQVEFRTFSVNMGLRGQTLVILRLRQKSGKKEFRRNIRWRLLICMALDFNLSGIPSGHFEWESIKFRFERPLTDYQNSSLIKHKAGKWIPAMRKFQPLFTRWNISGLLLPCPYSLQINVLAIDFKRGRANWALSGCLEMEVAIPAEIHLPPTSRDLR